MQIEQFVILKSNKPLKDDMSFVITTYSIHKSVIGYLKEQLPNHEFQVEKAIPYCFLVEPNKKTKAQETSVATIHLGKDDNPRLLFKIFTEDFADTTFRYLQAIGKVSKPDTMTVIPCDKYIVILNYNQFNSLLKLIISDLPKVVALDEYDKLPKNLNTIPLTIIPEG